MSNEINELRQQIGALASAVARINNFNTGELSSERVQRNEIIAKAEQNITDLDIANIASEQTLTDIDLRVLKLEGI